MELVIHTTARLAMFTARTVGKLHSPTMTRRRMSKRVSKYSVQAYANRTAQKTPTNNTPTTILPPGMALEVTLTTYRRHIQRSCGPLGRDCRALLRRCNAPKPPALCH